MPAKESQLLHDAVDALNRGDVDAFLACLDPDVEWEENADAFPGLAGTYRGQDAVRGWAEQAVAEFWKDLHMEVEEVTEGSDRRFLLGVLITAHGASSGVKTERRAWQVFRLTGDRVAERQGPYWSRDRALGAAGLQE